MTIEILSRDVLPRKDLPPDRRMEPPPASKPKIGPGPFSFDPRMWKVS